MKKTSKILLTMLFFSFSLLLNFNNTSKSVKAVSNESNVTQSENNALDKIWSKKLAKAGYVFKLKKDDLYHGKLNDRKVYSSEYADKIRAKKMLFKIDQVKSIKNGVTVHLLSKNGRHHFWTNFLTGTYNINGRKKTLRPIVNAEIKVIGTTDNQKVTKQINQIKKLSGKLKGRNKKLALESIKQLKRWLKDKKFANLPTLLIGSI